MTTAGYNMGGDLDDCARETDHEKFKATVKKLALQRNLAQRTIMLWCYLRSDSAEMAERLKGWIEEYDKLGENLMSLPEYEVIEG